MHQKHLAAFEPAALEHVVPDGEAGFRQGGRFRVGEARRQRQGVAAVHGDVFGIAAAGGER